MKETLVKLFEILNKNFNLLGIQVSILSFYVYSFLVLIIIKIIKGGNDK